jgi:hypothetical protein
MADQRFFGGNRRPLIHINWQSFLDNGFPAAWQWPLVDLVINSYTRWMHHAGIDLRPVFWNFTDRTSGSGDELIVLASEHHFGRLASWFGNTIVFHRRDGAGGTPWNFVPNHARPGEFDMQAIFHHELGHALGLDHASDDPTFMKSYWDFGRYGPYKADIAGVQGLYSQYDRNTLRQLRSTDGGATWAPVTNQLTTHGNAAARTSLGPAVTASDGGYVIAWSLPGNAPTWLRGDGSTFRFDQWFFYGGERSPFGLALGSDDAGTLLWAWTDEYRGAWPDQSQWHNVRVVRSADGAASWAWTSTPAQGKSIGAPGLACTRVGGQPVWILAWAVLDPADQERCASVLVSISRDGGLSWSAPIEMSRGRALSGVAVAANQAGRFVVAYADAPRGTINGMNQIRWHDCRVPASGAPQDLGVNATGQTTRIQPALAFDRARDRFIMAWRGQDRNTTLNVLTMGGSGTGFGNSVWVNRRSHVAPALAYNPVRSETVMWYASDD